MSELITLPPRNVTVVGAFNPAIFQPEWVRGHVPGVDGPIAVLLPGPQVGPVVLRFDETYVQVAADRLMIYGAASRIGQIAAAILRTLPHTPLVAAGVNFLFEGSRAASRIGPWAVGFDPAGLQALLKGTQGGLGFTHTVSREDGVRVTAKLVWPSPDPDVLLELNYHRDAASRPGEGRAKELAEHAERVVEFSEDADRIRQQVLGG